MPYDKIINALSLVEKFKKKLRSISHTLCESNINTQTVNKYQTLGESPTTVLMNNQYNSQSSRHLKKWLTYPGMMKAVITAIAIKAGVDTQKSIDALKSKLSIIVASRVKES